MDTVRIDESAFEYIVKNTQAIFWVLFSLTFWQYQELSYWQDTLGFPAWPESFTPGSVGLPLPSWVTRPVTGKVSEFTVLTTLLVKTLREGIVPPGSGQSHILAEHYILRPPFCIIKCYVPQACLNLVPPRPSPSPRLHPTSEDGGKIRSVDGGGCLFHIRLRE